MIRHTEILRRFEDDLARKEGRVPYARAMRQRISAFSQAKIRLQE